LRIIFLLFFLTTFLFSYQTEEKLKAVVIGKVAKYVSWKDESSSNFVITVLDNPFGNMLENIYNNKKIHTKNIKLVYINNITDLPADTKILYIPKKDSYELSMILQDISDKSILTISDIRGFAQKKGILQIYFFARKLRFKINLEVAKKNKLYIRSVLLHIAKIVKDES